MKGCCARCGYTAGIESFLTEAEWKAVAALAADLPAGCNSLVLRYIGLFAPDKRGLNAERAARLLNELRDMILNGTAYDRAPIRAPSYTWVEGITAVFDAERLRLPLKDHNYLLSVMRNKLAERTDMQQAEQHQARRGEARVSSGRMTRVADALPAVPAESKLPEIPAGEREEWEEMARAALLKEGFKPGFMPAQFVDQKARELYQEANNA